MGTMISSPYVTFTAADFMSYKIIRSYHPALRRSDKVMQTGLTLEQAQAHCRRPDTRKDGEWFDCYTKA
jgi:hypothetical protein